MSSFEQLIEDTLAEVQQIGGSLLERAQGQDKEDVETLLRVLGVKYSRLALGSVADEAALRADIRHAEETLKVIALRYQVQAISQVGNFLERLSARVARFAVAAALAKP